MDFAVPADHRVKKKESEKINKFLDLTRELIKTKPFEHKTDVDTNCNSWPRNGSQKTGKRNWGNWRSDENLWLQHF